MNPATMISSGVLNTAAILKSTSEWVLTHEDQIIEVCDRVYNWLVAFVRFVLVAFVYIVKNANKLGNKTFWTAAPKNVLTLIEELVQEEEIEVQDISAVETVEPKTVKTTSGNGKGFGTSEYYEKLATANASKSSKTKGGAAEAVPIVER